MVEFFGGKIKEKLPISYGIGSFLVRGTGLEPVTPCTSTGSFSSRSKMELLGAMRNASAPFLPFTLVIWHACCDACPYCPMYGAPYPC